MGALVGAAGTGAAVGVGGTTGAGAGATLGTSVVGLEAGPSVGSAGIPVGADVVTGVGDNVVATEVGVPVAAGDNVVATEVGDDVPTTGAGVAVLAAEGAGVAVTGGKEGALVAGATVGAPLQSQATKFLTNN